MPLLPYPGTFPENRESVYYLLSLVIISAAREHDNAPCEFPFCPEKFVVFFFFLSETNLQTFDRVEIKLCSRDLLNFSTLFAKKNFHDKENIRAPYALHLLFFLWLRVAFFFLRVKSENFKKKKKKFRKMLNIKVKENHLKGTRRRRCRLMTFIPKEPDFSEKKIIIIRMGQKNFFLLYVLYIHEKRLGKLRKSVRRHSKSPVSFLERNYFIPVRTH